MAGFETRPVDHRQVRRSVQAKSPQSFGGNEAAMSSGYPHGTAQTVQQSRPAALRLQR